MFAHHVLYLLFARPPVVLGPVAQSWLKRTFAEASKVPSPPG